jgi:hypothetical protein
MDNPAGLHTMILVRRLTLLLAAALVALLATGAAQAANPVVSAVQRSADARSSVVDMQVSTAVAGMTVVLTGTGTVRGQEAKMSVRTSAAGRSLAMDVIMLREGGGYVMYMRSPSLSAQLPAGKSWLRFDLQKAVAKLGVDFSSLLASSRALAPLEKGIVSTKRIGSDSIAGTATTHYQAVVDVHRAAAAVPEYAKQVAALERAAGIRLGRVTQEVWVGIDGRVRRLRSSTPTVVQGVKATTVQTLTYRAYDVPVSISAPPRGQVFDFS